MASRIETGHAKNVANFQKLIAFVNGYGEMYNPSKSTLKVPQLETLLSTAQTSLANVVTQNTNYNFMVSNRQAAFSDLKSLSTRLVNALQTTDASNQLVEDAKGFNRKLQGRKSTSTTTAQEDPDATAPKSISTSQQSYTQQIQHFAGLTAVLKSEPSYTPNETDLQTVTLDTKIADLTTKNNEVALAYVNVSNARIARNNTLYNTADSIFEVAADVKKYIKSIFGATSPEFAQVKGIEFKKSKN